MLLAIFRSSLLGPRLTAPTLEFSIVNKICDFSNFSQFLQLCANLDISYYKAVSGAQRSEPVKSGVPNRVKRKSFLQLAIQASCS